MIIKFIGNDGLPLICNWDAETQGELPEGAVELDRLPTVYGEDFIDGEWKQNARAKADNDAGIRHIEEARQLKYLEALMVKNGVPVAGGLLDAEAQLQGVDVEAIADAVMAKRAEFIEAEATRQEAQLSEPTPEA